MFEGYVRRLPARLLRDGYVVVGTGVSRYTAPNAPLAGWGPFLESGIQWCKEYTAVDAGWVDSTTTLLAGSLSERLQAAQGISDALGGPGSGTFFAWLSDTVGCLSPDNDKTDLILALEALQLPILTTNYDDLIEQVTGRVPVSWDEPAAVRHALRDAPARHVIHVHGYWRRPASVVLGDATYAAVLGSELVKGLMQHLAQWTTVLFVGCGQDGVNDPDFTRFQRYVTSTLERNDHPHYVVVKKDSLEMKAAEEAFASEPTICPVPYDGDFDQLPLFLVDLGQQLRGGTADEEAVLASEPPIEVALFGRDTEMQLLVGLAVTGQNALISGPPGMGKTALLREVARVAGRRGSTVLWLDLDAHAATDDISYWRALASILDIPIGALTILQMLCLSK